ncbi:MAG: zinc-ribbon domain-containing protein [Vicinamibacteria bacterium]|nr:zinc-ribbon domain-containing protein [Vicinamibacteria bacterium]
MFGEIPLIKVTATGLRGQDLSWWRHDPEYEPPLPRGAVRGNVKRQVFCEAHHVPKYFYLDEVRSCVQCGQEFTFRAAEQKHWYEALQFNFDSVPVRCLTCRRKRRSEHALREQIARAKAAVRARTDDPAAHVSLARAIVEYHERTQEGDLNEAISAARKAANLWQGAAEPLFWEGFAHARAGRSAKARDCLRAFVDHSKPGPASLRQRAREFLEKA